MKNLVSRIQKLEKAVQNSEDDICEIFKLNREDMTDVEIIEGLKIHYGIEITEKQFTKWRKEKFNDRILLMSPSFNIDKLMLKRRKAKGKIE